MSSESSLPKTVDQASKNFLSEHLKKLGMPEKEVDALITAIVFDYAADQLREEKGDTKKYKNPLSALVTEIENGETVFSYTPENSLIREVHIARLLIVDNSNDKILIEAGQKKRGTPVLKQDPIPAEKIGNKKEAPGEKETPLDAAHRGFKEEFGILKDEIQGLLLSYKGIKQEKIKASPSYPISRNIFINHVYLLDVHSLPSEIKTHFFGPEGGENFTHVDASGGKILIFQWKNIFSTDQWQIEGVAFPSKQPLNEVLLPYHEYLQKGEGEQPPSLEPEPNL